MKSFSLICLICLPVMAQVSETVIIEQTGKGNCAYFDDHLSEKYNEVTIIQNGNYNGTAFDLNGDGVNDPTTIIIETPASVATIEEYGNFNSAFIHQKGGSPTRGSIYQDGNKNCAILIQNWAEGGNAEIVQDGKHNRAEIDQYGEFTFITATQNGYKNTLTTNQLLETDLQATQNGNGNYAFINAEYFSNMYLNQQGNNNYSEQICEFEYRDPNSGSVYQNGNNNTAYQNRGSRCEADIQQTSDGNSATQYLRNIGDETDMRGVYAQIFQSGGGCNIAHQTQVGVGLSSTIIQTGSYNVAESYQGN